MSKKKIEVARRYNETAEMYDRRYKTIQFSKYREVFPELEMGNRDLILDIGGGTGLLLEYFKPQQQNIVICDLSIEMLKTGKAKHPSGNFICADSENLPFRDSCFHITCFFSILQNLESPTSSLQEGTRVLLKNGKIVVTALSKIFDSDELIDHLKDVKCEIEKNWYLHIEDIAVIGTKM